MWAFYMFQGPHVIADCSQRRQHGAVRSSTGGWPRKAPLHKLQASGEEHRVRNPCTSLRPARAFLNPIPGGAPDGVRARVVLVRGGLRLRPGQRGIGLACRLPQRNHLRGKHAADTLKP